MPGATLTCVHTDPLLCVPRISTQPSRPQDCVRASDGAWERALRFLIHLSVSGPGRGLGLATEKNLHSTDSTNSPRQPQPSAPGSPDLGHQQQRGRAGEMEGGVSRLSQKLIHNVDVLRGLCQSSQRNAATDESVWEAHSLDGKAPEPEGLRVLRGGRPHGLRSAGGRAPPVADHRACHGGDGPRSQDTRSADNLRAGSSSL